MLKVKLCLIKTENIDEDAANHMVLVFCKLPKESTIKILENYKKVYLIKLIESKCFLSWGSEKDNSLWETYFSNRFFARLFSIFLYGACQIFSFDFGRSISSEEYKDSYLCYYNPL